MIGAKAVVKPEGMPLAGRSFRVYTRVDSKGMTEILLIEDESVFRLLCVDALKAEGFVVHECSTIAEARAQLERSRPDLVLFDISLPDGNAVDLVRCIQGSNPMQIPFIFFTGSQDDVKMRLECFRLGASDYIKKPFAVEELIARIRIHLEIQRTKGQPTEIEGRLRRREAMHRNMTDRIVHDLRAPIASIKGMLELISRQECLSEAEFEYFNHIGSMADFMLLMLTDLLDIGRAQSVGLHVTPTKVDLSQLEVSVRKFFLGSGAIRGIKLELSISTEFCFIETDQNLLFRILANLLSNAIKVSMPGQSVILESGRGEGGRVRFCVLDRGPGVPESEKERIFEKFITARKTGDRWESGTGIGLSFCRLAAESLRGKVWVEDRPGGGSRFILEFPAAILDSQRL